MNKIIERIHDAQLPNLQAKCGKHFRFIDLIECGETFHALQPNNIPLNIQTYQALEQLTKSVLDPVVARFGEIKLSYGFSCHNLYKDISRNICPALDQHAAHELKSNGQPVCSRGGAAVDFFSEGVGSFRVAKWIIENCPFDRIYYYGDNRPVHVSVGPAESFQVIMMPTNSVTRTRIPRRINRSKFLSLGSDEEFFPLSHD